MVYTEIHYRRLHIAQRKLQLLGSDALDGGRYSRGEKKPNEWIKVRRHPSRENIISVHRERDVERPFHIFLPTQLFINGGNFYIIVFGWKFLWGEKASESCAYLFVVIVVATF